MTAGDTNRRGRRRWSGWDDIVQFEWNDLLEDTPIDDLLVIDDRTKEVIDYLGHAPLEDIMQFEWDDFLEDTPIDDLLVIDDQTRKVLDYLGHAPLEDIMQFEWDDFLEDPQAAAVIADEEVERPVRRQRGYHMRGTACSRRLSR